MAEEGSSSAQVGSINVGVGGDITGLQSKLAQAEAATKASAARMAATMAAPVGDKAAAFGRGTIGAGGVGMGIGLGVSAIGGERAVSSVTAASDKATRSFGSLLKSARGLRSVLSRLFFPVALIASAQKLAGIIDGLVFAAQDYRKELEATNAGPLADMQAALIQLRIQQGAMTELQAKLLELRTKEIALEEELRNKLNAKLSVIVLLDGVMRGLTAGSQNLLNYYTAFANEAEKAEKAARSTLKSHEGILTALDDEKKAMEEQDRIQRRMREQAKRDITHTTIDASRIGPALDLLQRQRTNN